MWDQGRPFQAAGPASAKPLRLGELENPKKGWSAGAEREGEGVAGDEAGERGRGKVGRALSVTSGVEFYSEKEGNPRERSEEESNIIGSIP